MPDFLRPRGRKDETDEVEDPAEIEWVTTAPGIYAAKPQDDAAAENGLSIRPASESVGLNMANVGEHVASVLTSAESAAQKIRAEAEQDAKDSRQEAARVAADIRERATEEAQAERASTRRLVEEAEATSHGIRSDADLYADERRREADAQAIQVVRDAERRAAAIADSSGERHRVLLTNITASETRLRELAKSLRGVAATLDDVVGVEERSEAVDDGIGRERDAMMLESLRVDVPEGQTDAAARQ
jgi:hypothetical protein